MESSSGADVLAERATAARYLNRVDRLIVVEASLGWLRNSLLYSRVNVNLRQFFIQLVIPLFAIVLAIVLPLFCVLGGIASYRCARQRRAVLSPSSHRCLCVLIPAFSRQSFDLYELCHP